MEKKIEINKERGITLIALVVTIIVLIILAGITINTTISEDGIIKVAEEGKFKTEVQQIREILEVNMLNRKVEDSTFNKDLLNAEIRSVLVDEELYNDYTDRLYIYKGELVYISNIQKEIIWAKELGLKIMNSDEDRLALYIDRIRNNAIEKNQITKNQYTYRIEGELKTRIEEKLGRKIDYSVDRFYEVKYKNVLPEIEDGKTFIYSDNSGIAVEIRTQTEKNISTWFWKGASKLDVAVMEDKDIQDQFFEKLKSYNISQIYISQRFDRLVGNIEIENFVANAYSRNIKVYIVTGDTNYLDSGVRDKSIYTSFDTLEKYNKSVDYNKRIAGISYDAEVWLNSEYSWKTNEQIRKEHIQYIKDAKEYADSKNLEVIFTLPFWVVQFNYTNSNGDTINMYDEASKTLDEVNLMLYRDTSDGINSLVVNNQSNAEKSLREYSQENECTLNIGVESAPSSEGDRITFYEEETETQGYLIGELNKLKNSYSPNWENYNFSIHHASKLIEILGGIEVDNIIKIGTAQELVNFLSSGVEGKGKIYKLTSDIDMAGYTVSAYNNSDTGFNGTFNGNNYTIENLFIESTELTGLFKKVGENGVVKNLNIKNSTIKTSEFYAGAISGTNGGTIINCSNQNSTITAKQYAGGLVGRNYGTIKNSYNTGNITCEKFCVGGITGKNETNGLIYNVYSTGTITEKGADGAKGAITAQNVGIIEKAYWLEGSCTKAIGYQSEGETIKMTSAEMMRESFVSTLNNNRVIDINLSEWKISKEGEYPHF